MGQIESHPVIQEAIRTRPPKFIALWGTSVPFDSLHGTIGSFLNRGLNGGILTIEHKKSKHLIQFHKHIVSKGQYGIELVLHESDRLDDPFDQVKDYCIQQGKAFNEDEKSSDGRAEVLRIHCGKDVDEALLLLIIVFAEILGLLANSRFSINEENVSRWMEVIDSPRG